VCRERGLSCSVLYCCTVLFLLPFGSGRPSLRASRGDSHSQGSPSGAEAAPPAPAPALNFATLILESLLKYQATASRDAFSAIGASIKPPGPSLMLAPTHTAWQSVGCGVRAQLPNSDPTSLEVKRLILQGLMLPNVHWSFQQFVDNNGTVLSTLLPGYMLQVLYLPVEETAMEGRELRVRSLERGVRGDAAVLCAPGAPEAALVRCRRNLVSTPPMNVELVDAIPSSRRTSSPREPLCGGPRTDSSLRRLPSELPARDSEPQRCDIKECG